MEFGILGPLQVTDGERTISLDAPKQRALLGLLLLHPNEVVPSERMIDELWGERPPPTAAKIVQNYVSQLRRAVGTNLISTQAPGYALCVADDAVDAERFRRLSAAARRLAATGDREQADELYREALALWRGPPLADVAFESFARNELERLSEERLDALTARIEGELELGRHEQLVAELEALVRQYPLRERLRGQLMVALYRCRRQADALDAYRDARSTLVEQLGLEPGRELQDLERAILTHDPALDAPHLPQSRRETRERRRLRRPALAVVVLPVLALGLGLAFMVDHSQSPSTALAPDSVGFVDARTDRVTKSIPVGRGPRALTVADGSVWVSNLQDGTVTWIDPGADRGYAMPVRGHPTGIAAYRGAIWVWTEEGTLVRIDPRYKTAGRPIRLATTGGTFRSPGRIAAGGGFLWITVPETTILRVDPAHPARRLSIDPQWGSEGPILEHAGKAWAAGSSYSGYVYPIDDRTAAPGTGIPVGGPVHDLTVAKQTLWVLSGGAVRQTPHPALRPVDLHDQIPSNAIDVGADPVAIVDAAGSIWVASESDGTLLRVDPVRDLVVRTIDLGATPVALAADPAQDGVWVVVR